MPENKKDVLVVVDKEGLVIKKEISPKIENFFEDVYTTANPEAVPKLDIPDFFAKWKKEMPQVDYFGQFRPDLPQIVPDYKLFATWMNPVIQYPKIGAEMPKLVDNPAKGNQAELGDQANGLVENRENLGDVINAQQVKPAIPQQVDKKVAEPAKPIWEAVFPKKKASIFDYPINLCKVSFERGNQARVQDGPLAGSIIHLKEKLNFSGDYSNSYVHIDLNLLDLTKYNPATKRWKSNKNPTVSNFQYLIHTDTHPMVSIGKNHDKKYGLYHWLSEHEPPVKILKKAEKVSKIATKDNIPLYYRLSNIEVVSTMRQGDPLAVSKALSAQVGYPYTRLVEQAVDKEEKTTLVNNKTPVLTEPEKQKLYNEILKNWSGNGWDYMDMCEFDDNTEMIERVMNHMKDIPGFEIQHLSKRNLISATSGYGYTEDCYPEGYARTYLKGQLSGNNHRNALWLGEAWAMHFTVNGKDGLGRNLVYFCTPEQYLKAYENHPKILAEIKPWADLMWICSWWCERNNWRAKEKGEYDMSNPVRRQLSLFAWIVGPYIEHCITHGSGGNPLEGVVKIVSGKLDRASWQKREQVDAALESALKRIQDLANVEKKVINVDKPIPGVDFSTKGYVTLEDYITGVGNQILATGTVESKYLNVPYNEYAKGCECAMCTEFENMVLKAIKGIHEEFKQYPDFKSYKSKLEKV